MTVVLRHRLFSLAGKIVHTARRVFLCLSDRYRYCDTKSQGCTTERQ
jgi:hypothetical protein